MCERERDIEEKDNDKHIMITIVVVISSCVLR